MNVNLPPDALAELDCGETIDNVHRAIESGGHEVIRVGHVRNLINRLPDLGVDIVFNICEGVGGRNRESEVPVILDVHNIPYIGSDGLTLGLSLDKVMAKKCLSADNIATPRYVIACDGARCGAGSLKFPMIVKPRHEGSSKGISEDSIVTNRRGLMAQIRKVVDVYRQPALVEEFISGSEYTVLVIGNEAPQALPPVQISIMGQTHLGDLVYTSRRVTTDEIAYLCPPRGVKKALVKKLQEMAVRAYRCLDCRDFGRVDFRVDSEGNPYVLEINPLPSLSPEDVFPKVAESIGMTYNSLIAKIVDIGMARYGLN
jgi:D-alanine-D-alanine ligase